MDRHITGVIHRATRAPIYPHRQLIKWSNDIAKDDGYCAACRPTPDGKPQGQYCMAPVYITRLGEWIGTYSENTGATRLTRAEMQRIAILQRKDECTIDEKMNWAMDGGNNTWGSIMRATYPSGSEWRDATDIQMIGAVFAGQWVEIVEHATFYTTLNGNKGMTPMSRIRTYQPHEWYDEYATQLVTAVTKDNVYYEEPRGLFRWPIYFGYREAWVFDRWLEPL